MSNCTHVNLGKEFPLCWYLIKIQSLPVLRDFRFQCAVTLSLLLCVPFSFSGGGGPDVGGARRQHAGQSEGSPGGEGNTHPGEGARQRSVHDDSATIMETLNAGPPFANWKQGE